MSCAAALVQCLPQLSGSTLLISPFPRRPSQYVSASSWPQLITHAKPSMCAFCMTLTASSTVYPSTTLSNTFTTYSRRLTLSLCSMTRYFGGFFFLVSGLSPKPGRVVGRSITLPPGCLLPDAALVPLACCTCCRDEWREFVKCDRSPVKASLDCD